MRGRARFDGLPDRVFVSHAYKDTEACDTLVRSLSRAGKSHVVFPARSSDPRVAVSDDIVEAIRSCRALIFLRGGRSSVSPWVHFERDYAARTGLPIYEYDHRNRRLARRHGTPRDLCVNLLVDDEQRTRVNVVLDWMRDERGFELENAIAGISSTDEIGSFPADVLESGRPLVWFLGARSEERSALLLYVRREFVSAWLVEEHQELDIDDYEEWIYSNSLFVRCDPAWRPNRSADRDYGVTLFKHRVADAFDNGRGIDIVHPTETNGMDFSRVDDVLVRITMMASSTRSYFEGRAEEEDDG
jgi:hypothetical protein